MRSRNGRAEIRTCDGSNRRLRLTPCSPVGSVRRTDATSNGGAAANAVSRSTNSVFMLGGYAQEPDSTLNTSFSGGSGSVRLVRAARLSDSRKKREPIPRDHLFFVVNKSARELPRTRGF